MARVAFAVGRGKPDAAHNTMTKKKKKKTSYDQGGKSVILTRGPKADHTHTATLDSSGNGISSTDEGHAHKIVGNKVQPAGEGPHTHPLR